MGLMFVWILFHGGPSLGLELNQSVWDFVFGFSFVPTGLLVANWYNGAKLVPYDFWIRLVIKRMGWYVGSK